MNDVRNHVSHTKGCKVDWIVHIRRQYYGCHVGVRNVNANDYIAHSRSPRLLVWDHPEWPVYRTVPLCLSGPLLLLAFLLVYVCGALHMQQDMQGFWLRAFSAEYAVTDPHCMKRSWSLLTQKSSGDISFPCTLSTLSVFFLLHHIAHTLCWRLLNNAVSPLSMWARARAKTQAHS